MNYCVFAPFRRFDFKNTFFWFFRLEIWISGSSLVSTDRIENRRCRAQQRWEAHHGWEAHGRRRGWISVPAQSGGCQVRRRECLLWSALAHEEAKSHAAGSARRNIAQRSLTSVVAGIQAWQIWSGCKLRWIPRSDVPMSVGLDPALMDHLRLIYHDYCLARRLSDRRLWERIWVKLTQRRSSQRPPKAS